MLTISKAISGFLTDASIRCSKTTIVFYKKRLRGLQVAFGDKPVKKLKPKAIAKYLAAANQWPDGSPKAPDTIRSNIVAWEQLQKWLLERKLIKRPITDKIRKPGGRKRDTLPTLEETAALLAVANPDFCLIYRALRLTGARPGELCAAQISDIDHSAGEIVRKEHKTAKKTGKPRRIPIAHDALIAILKESIGERTEGHIFLRKSGRPWTTEAVSTAYRTARVKAGLREGLVLYLARHEHATEIYKQTGDIKAVAMALGHTQLTTAERYTRVDGERLKTNQKLFNENLNKDT